MKISTKHSRHEISCILLKLKKLAGQLSKGVSTKSVAPSGQLISLVFCQVLVPQQIGTRE